MNMLHVSFVSMIIKYIQFEYNFKKFISCVSNYFGSNLGPSDLISDCTLS